MQAHIAPSDAARPDDPSRTADHGRFPREGSVRAPRVSDAQVIGRLCDLFAGRVDEAYGEKLDWWAEALQSDLSPKAACQVALVALSGWPFHQRDGAAGVQMLRDLLITRARFLIARSLRDNGEAA